jgi:hypothetical protein
MKSADSNITCCKVLAMKKKKKNKKKKVCWQNFLFSVSPLLSCKLEQKLWDMRAWFMY